MLQDGTVIASAISNVVESKFMQGEIIAAVGLSVELSMEVGKVYPSQLTFSFIVLPLLKHNPALAFRFSPSPRCLSFFPKVHQEIVAFSAAEWALRIICVTYHK